MKTEWITYFKCFLKLPSVLSFTLIQTFYTAQTFSIHVEVFASLTPRIDNEERKRENRKMDEQRPMLIKVATENSPRIMYTCPPIKCFRQQNKLSDNRRGVTARAEGMGRHQGERERISTTAGEKEQVKRSEGPMTSH